MDNLDQRILEALNEEDRRLLHQYDEKNIFLQFLNSYRGKWGLYMAITTLAILVLFIFMIYCGVTYFSSDDQKTQQLSLVGFVLGFVSIGMAKMMGYIHMGNMNVIREVKRLELQVSLLAERQ